MPVGVQDDPAATADCFATVARLATNLGLAELSMGMTDDLDLAELLALTRGEDWREDSADPRDTSLASTGPLVLDYKTKRAKTSR